jgi:hypothetical protein
MHRVLLSGHSTAAITSGVFTRQDCRLIVDAPSRPSNGNDMTRLLVALLIALTARIEFFIS